MVNRNLFKSASPRDVIKNEAGGVAYKMSAKHALAQYAFTGTLANTFYIGAQAQLDAVLKLCKECDPEYVAKTAIAARKGYMKDMPAMLAAYLHATDPKLLAKVFDRIINNGLMLKKFVQIVRSGVTGRRGFGSTTKRTIRKWFDGRTDVQLMYDNIGGGKAVSLEHILRMVRPKPKDKTRSAMYAWIRGAKITEGTLIQPVRFKTEDGTFKEEERCYNFADLPERLRLWEAYKAHPDEFEYPPKVPFRMLTSLKLGTKEWTGIAKNMSWDELRQNLVTLNRHGVFDSPDMVKQVCDRLRSPEEIAKANVFPYQLLAAYLNTGPTPTGYGWTTSYWNTMGQHDAKGKEADRIKVPKELRYALEAALEEAVKNVPTVEGKVFICPDTSGSMGYPITGDRYHYGKPPATKVRCVDVAGLITAAILRRNPRAAALPFSTRVHDVELHPMASVMQNAEKFTSLGGGGTSCSEPLRVLNGLNAEGDVVVFVSDYESWSDPRGNSGTAMMQQWNRFKVRNPQAKLICIDLTPRGNKQVRSHPDILHIGGFSDQVFNIMRDFVEGELGPEQWIGTIKEVSL